jgi:putative ABC transport system permease protein
MTLLHLVKKEIGYHKLTFVLGLLSVIVAVGVLVSLLVLLHAHDIQTERILSEKEKEIEEQMQEMENKYKIIMEEYGFNLIILPKNQNLGDFYDKGYASEFMPEDYVDKLAQSNLVTIRYLLPIVEQKIRWSEELNRTIFLFGTCGKVPFTKETPEEPPALVAVPPGTVILGYELCNSLNLKVGNEVILLGETFKVSECHPQRGTKEDITVWINLKTAQHLLGRENQINEIQALKTYASGLDFKSIKEDINQILPNTQVVVLENKVTTMAEARDRSKTTADFSLETERQHRLKIRGELETFASWLIPLVIMTSMVLIVFLTLSNLRQRRGEIATLRALGYRSGQILYVFLAKAFFLGLIGALLGITVSFFVVMLALALSAQEIFKLFSIPMLIGVLAGAPILSILASWVPATLAAHEDPAAILREE